MAFEFYNSNPHAVGCSFHRPIGLIVIPRGGYAPTAEQEREGVSADIFKDFVPVLLRPTPPEIRRRLLEEAGLGVPRELVVATSALADSSAAGEGCVLRRKLDTDSGGSWTPISAQAGHRIR